MYNFLSQHILDRLTRLSR